MFFLLLTKSFPGLSDEARSRASKCNQVWVLSVVVILHIILSSCQLLILPVLTKNVYHFLLSGFWTFLKGQTHLFSSLVVRPITKWVNLLGKVWVQYWTYFQDLFDYISEFGDPGLDESISHKFFTQVKTKPSSSYLLSELNDFRCYRQSHASETEMSCTGKISLLFP